MSDAQRLTPERDTLSPSDVDAVLERFDQTEPALQRQIVAELVRQLAAARRELEQTDERLIDFTGVPTIDEALQVIISPVEWDALASFHGVTIVGSTPTAAMIERAAQAVCSYWWPGLQLDDLTAANREDCTSLARSSLIAAMAKDGGA